MTSLPLYPLFITVIVIQYQKPKTKKQQASQKQLNALKQLKLLNDKGEIDPKRVVMACRVRQNTKHMYQYIPITGRFY